MDAILGFLIGLAALLTPIVIYVEISARRNGSGMIRAFKGAFAPKVEVSYLVIRANGHREEERLARSSKATIMARIRLIHISFLMHAKKMLEDFSRYLKKIGG